MNRVVQGLVALVVVLLIPSVLYAQAITASRQVGAQPASDPLRGRTKVVRTAEGPVRGIIRSGVRQFLGIRYAAPPLGDLRWRPPQPPAPWGRTLDAVAFGNRCAQDVTLGVFAAPSYEEDCLFLNVFAPLRVEPKTPRPVMVWIHGGGNWDGESDDYDGSKLASQGGVIVVTINFRLNVFGFFSHPAIDHEGHANHAYGIMDQQLALHWVQRNIRAFGGNPKNVTIFGESGGALDVKAHMASPLSKGLFQRGIAVDLAPLDVMPTLTLEKTESLGQAFANAAGCADQSARCLRSLSVRQVLQTNHPPNDAGGGKFFADFGNAVDGKVIPLSWDQAFATGRFNRVPFINGTTLDVSRWGVVMNEAQSGKTLTAKEYPDRIRALYPADADSVLGKYPLDRYDSPNAALTTVTSDSRQCSARAFDRVIARHGVPVYAYVFADRSAPFYFERGATLAPGAAHTLDMQYFFPLYHGAQGTPKPLNAAQEKLSNTIVSYWTMFARNGDPNSPGTPVWPRFAEGRESVQSLLLPEPATVTDFAERHNCALFGRLEGYAERLK